MAAHKDKHYDCMTQLFGQAVKRVGLVSHEANSCGLLDQAGLLDRRMQVEPHPWPVAYGWDEKNIL